MESKLVSLVSWIPKFCNFIMSTHSHWHQFSANRILNLVWSIKKLYLVKNCSTVICHSCESSIAERQPWAQEVLEPRHSPARQLWSGLLHSMPVCSGLHCSAPVFSTTSLVFQLSQGNRLFCGKGNCAPRANNSHLWSLVCPSSCK